MKTWKPYAFVGLLGFALMGVFSVGSCAYADLAFLHEARTNSERVAAANALIKQQQQVVAPTPPRAAPTPTVP